MRKIPYYKGLVVLAMTMLVASFCVKIIIAPSVTVESHYHDLHVQVTLKP